MRRVAVIAVCLGLACTASVGAQDAPPAVAPTDDPNQLLILPRAVVDAAFRWGYANGMPAQIVDAWRACMRDNPHAGPTIRIGADGCAPVTDRVARDAANDAVATRAPAELAQWQHVAEAYADQIRAAGGFKLPQ